MLIDAIKDGKQPSLRASSVVAIQSIGPRECAAVPALTALRSEREEALREMTALALPGSGPLEAVAPP